MKKKGVDLNSVKHDEEKKFYFSFVKKDKDESFLTYSYLQSF